MVHELGCPNFSPAEIACRGTGRLLVNGRALDGLQALRDRLGKPLTVHSGYRSPEQNKAVGGAKQSKHLEGAAPLTAFIDQVIAHSEMPSAMDIERLRSLREL